MYLFLDVFLLLVHLLLILFVLAGWAFPRSRRAHLALIILMIASWIGLGSCYGLGYCPLTDWHWQVKRQLGQSNLPASYIKYYLDLLTGQDWDPLVVDTAVAGLGLTAFSLNLLARRRPKTTDFP